MRVFSYQHSLWIKSDVEALEQRILRLTKNSQRRWGSMSVSGMLAHCSLALSVYGGELDLPMRTRWYSVFSKWFALSALPFPHGIRLPFKLPGEEGLVFEEQREGLLRAVDRFSELYTDHLFKPHFLLGELTREEFGMLAHKHTSHHLRQFGC